MTVPSKQLPEKYKEETFRYLQHFMRMGVVGNNRKEYEISNKKESKLQLEIEKHRTHALNIYTVPLRLRNQF